MTDLKGNFITNEIIPYQELLGNYDDKNRLDLHRLIIPYQELLGNYDSEDLQAQEVRIIPYQELLGNYDISLYLHNRTPNYTIPRAIREL